MYRGTSGSRYLGEVTGSDKRFAFPLTADKSKSVHLFESAIDFLSYATLMKSKRRIHTMFLEMSGSTAVWKEVLAVYAVKTNTDPVNAQEIATMNDGKKQLLKDVFWQMNHS